MVDCGKDYFLYFFPGELSSERAERKELTKYVDVYNIIKCRSRKCVISIPT